MHLYNISSAMLCMTYVISPFVSTPVTPVMPTTITALTITSKNLGFITGFITANTTTPSTAECYECDALHAFHISKTDMVFQPAEKSMQITMHIFIDDLEEALEKQGKSKLFIGTERENQESNNLIANYLQSNFTVQINGKQTPYTWVGKETTKDKQAMWVYLEIKNIREVRNISVENRVLTEVFADQKNIVQVNIPSKKQGYFLLSKNKTMDSASF